MKRRIALFLLAAAMLMLTACGSKTETAPTVTEQQTQATEPSTQATEAPTQPATTAPKLDFSGVYRQPWRDEIGGTVVERYSYIVLNADHTGNWIEQAVATLTWNENQLKTTVGEVCDIALTQGNGTVNLLVYPDPRYSDTKTPSVYEKIDKLPADMEAMIAGNASEQYSAPDYPGTYCQTWTEEIGGTVAVRNSYYVLNADHTGYVVAQGVGKIAWNDGQLMDDLGQTYSIALTQTSGTVNLLVYESQGTAKVYKKIDKLPADIAAMIAESTMPQPKIYAPEITKNPTSETVNEGGNAYFVARANNYSNVNWYILSADRSTRIPVNNAPWNFPGVAVTGEGSTTLLLSNIPATMNGWCVEAVFTGEGGSATTIPCFVYVNKTVKAPLYAVPSSGIFVNDQPVQLTAAPGNTIYYELYDDVGFAQTGTVQSGGYVYVPIIANCRYVARLVAYVIGDQANATVCEYTMDGLATPVPDYPPETIPGPTEPDAPSFNGGYFYNNNDAEITFSPIGDGGFTASVGIIRVVSFDGSAAYHGGVLYLDLKDPNGNYVGGEFDVVSGTLTISSSSWDEVPAGSTYYGLH